MTFLDYQLNDMLFAILMSFRLGAFFVSMPIFSEFKIPILVRVVLPMAFSILIAPALPKDLAPNMASHTLIFLYAIVAEVLVGLVMGFSIHILFMLANVAGELTGLQIGFSIASVFDPNLGQSALVAFFMKLFLTLLFFYSNMHLTFIWTVVQSYYSIPPGANFLSLTEVIPGMIKLFDAVYLMAFRFAMPVLAAIFLANVMVGIISITAPQMNFYFNVAISLNVVFGLMVVALSFSLLFQFFNTGAIALQDFLSGYFIVR